MMMKIPIQASALTVFALILALGGCANFDRLKEDLGRLEEQAHEFQIRVDIDGVETNGIVMVALSDAEGSEIAGIRTLTRPATFEILLPQQPLYFFAYADLNQDLRFQAGEPYGWATPHPLDPLAHPDMLVRITITPNAAAEPAIPAELIDRPFKDTIVDGVHINIGTTTSLDDPLFTLEQAEKGLWQPFAFMEDGGTGVHFLADYDHAKTPVLFVHGINGSPQNFRDLIQSLDTQRYQAWVYSYPSGLPLETVSEGLYQLVEIAHARYRFSELHVIAHSMGGLVSRRAINICVHQQACSYLRSYTTISTPWGGVASAQSGVEWAPTVVPVWRDMTPNSAFVRTLFDTPLPLPHHLIFGFKNSSIFGKESSDGTIVLESQLVQAAQNQASDMHGFNEDHVSILSSPLLKDKVYAILDAASQR